VSRETSIQEALVATFSPVFLEIENESHKHSVKPGSETHFKITVASDAFTGKSRIERHRAVHAALKEQLASGLHALSVAAFTAEEWSRDPSRLPTPDCLGGSKKDRAKAPAV
jgi:BolA protein